MNADDATHPDRPTSRRRFVSGAFPAAAGIGWLLNQLPGPLHVLFVVLTVGALIYLAVPAIKKVLAGDQMSWPKQALARWRSIPSAIRTITVSTAAFFVTLGVFLWAIGVRINIREVILSNPWIVAALIGAALVGFVKSIDAADRRAAARRDD